MITINNYRGALPIITIFIIYKVIKYKFIYIFTLLINLNGSVDNLFNLSS